MEYIKNWDPCLTRFQVVHNGQLMLPVYLDKPNYNIRLHFIITIWNLSAWTQTHHVIGATVSTLMNTQQALFELRKLVKEEQMRLETGYGSPYFGACQVAMMILGIDVRGSVGFWDPVPITNRMAWYLSVDEHDWNKYDEYTFDGLPASKRIPTTAADAVYDVYHQPKFLTPIVNYAKMTSVPQPQQTNQPSQIVSKRQQRRNKRIPKSQRVKNASKKSAQQPKISQDLNDWPSLEEYQKH